MKQDSAYPWNTASPWLLHHCSEPGQNFRSYILSPQTPEAKVPSCSWLSPWGPITPWNQMAQGVITPSHPRTPLPESSIPWKDLSPVAMLTGPICLRVLATMHVSLHQWCSYMCSLLRPRCGPGPVITAGSYPRRLLFCCSC